MPRIGVELSDGAADLDGGAGFRGSGGVGDQDRLGEAGLEVDDGGGVACPVGDQLHGGTHGEHAVGDHAGQFHARGEGLVPVDGVEVAGCAGVLDQVGAGDLDGAAADVLAGAEFCGRWGSWLLSLSADEDG